LTGYPINLFEKVPFSITLTVTHEGYINGTVKCLTSSWNASFHCTTKSRGVIPDTEVAVSTVRIQELLKGNNTPSLIVEQPQGNTIELQHIRKFAMVLEKAEAVENADKQALQNIRKWFDVNKNSCTEVEVKEKLQELKQCTKEWGGYIIEYYNDTQ